MSGKPPKTGAMIREIGYDAFELSSKRDEIFGTQSSILKQILLGNR
jgi:hypothetical protein